MLVYTEWTPSRRVTLHLLRPIYKPVIDIILNKHLRSLYSLRSGSRETVPRPREYVIEETAIQCREFGWFTANEFTELQTYVTVFRV